MKKRMLLFWRILVAAGMVGVLILAGLVINVYIKSERRIYIYKSEYSDSYFIVMNLKDGTLRLKSAETGKYITPVFDRMFEGTVRDTLTVFFQKNRRGYLNVYTGKIVIPAQYDRAWVFSEGLGAVVKNGKVGFINRQGKLVIPYQFTFRLHWTERVDFLFKGGTCTAIDSTGKHGLIDKTGKWVIEPKYDYINNPVNGFRIVRNDGIYGIMDETLQLRLPIEYDWIEIINDGFIVQKDSEQKLLAFDGETILQPFVYNNTYVLYYNSGKINESGETIFVKSDYRKFSIGGKNGLMDKHGKVSVPAIYENISAMDNDLFSCEIDRNHYITINGKGEILGL